MFRLFVRHAVRDYAAWRKYYDETAQERVGHGVLGDSVCRTVGKTREVTVTHDFATREAAERFLNLPRLRDGMAEAGVAAAPTVWLTEVD